MAITVRTLAREEIGFCLDLAGAEGWNPGRYDAAPFFAADAEGFLVAEDENGAKVGCISAVRYDAFGFIGLLIVRPEFRGNGIGAMLFERGLARLEGLPVGLDAVPEEEDRYARAGFVRTHLNARYRAEERGSQDRFASAIALDRLRVLSDEVVAYDRACFGAARAEFLQSWVAQPDVVALVARSLRSGEIVGYGVGREARKGTKIGPLFASRLDIAAMLLDTIVGRTRPPWSIDVPTANFPALALAESYGMETQFENVRMWRGDPPRTEIERVYGIASFQLG